MKWACKMNYKVPIAAISKRNHYATLPTKCKYNLLCLYRLDNCVVVHFFFAVIYIFLFFLFALSKPIAYGISFIFVECKIKANRYHQHIYAYLLVILESKLQDPVALSHRHSKQLHRETGIKTLIAFWRHFAVFSQEKNIWRKWPLQYLL